MKIAAKIYQLLLAIGFLNLSFTSFAQDLKTYKFEEIEGLQVNEPRNVVVFIHTDWCSYCKAMEVKTFRKEEITESLNSHFYFIDFDAESKEDIIYNGIKFKYRPTGKNTGLHEIAEALGEIDGKLSYPTLVILNPENEIVFQYDSFINYKEMEKILNQSLIL